MKLKNIPALLLAAAFLGTASLALAHPGDSADEPLVLGFQGAAESLDPILHSVSVAYSWQRHITDTITFRMPDGEVAPLIATSWKNINPLQWELTIREGVKFHDGSDMTPEDVGYSIMDFKDNPKSRMNVYVSGVKDFEVKDDKTLIVNFNEPDPVFPVHLTMINVLPSKLIEEQGREAFVKHPIGTGPYEFVSWQSDDHLILKAFDDFWGEQPDFKHVKLQKIPNDSTRVASLLSGEVQLAQNVSPSDMARVEKDGDHYIATNPGARVMFLGLDYAHENDSPGVSGVKENPFMNPDVRKAVSLSIDRELIADKLFDGAVATTNQFLPPKSFAYDENDEVPARDVEEAKKLLAQAGLEKGFGLRLDTPNDRYLHDTLVTQAIGGFLQEAGIDATVDASPMVVYLSSKLYKDDSSAFLLGWGNSNSLSTWKAVFHCVDKDKGMGGVNYAGYCNPEADALIDKAMETFDDDERNELIRQAYDTAIHKDFAYIPMYYQSIIAGLDKNIEWEPDPDDIILAWRMKSNY